MITGDNQNPGDDRARPEDDGTPDPRGASGDPGLEASLAELESRIIALLVDAKRVDEDATLAAPEAGLELRLRIGRIRAGLRRIERDGSGDRSDATPLLVRDTGESTAAGSGAEGGPPPDLEYETPGANGEDPAGAARKGKGG